MKNIFLFFSCLVCYQCSPQSGGDEDYEKFVHLKKENSKDSKIISCAVKPVNDDVDLSHYEIYGFAYRGRLGCGNLKVAFEKNGQRLNYKIPLSPDENIKLNEIYMTDKDKEKFHNGKMCKFRVLFEEQDEKPQFMLKDGVLEKYVDDGKIEDVDEKKINISIFVVHKTGEVVHKASDEIVLD
ncbi:MAG: hypothetical protein LBD32_02505 [Cytophagales bacterium]|jgi:hypothetical protein|nr:hypothetical protein [Cytophagales bacterium]